MQQQTRRWGMVVVLATLPLWAGEGKSVLTGKMKGIDGTDVDLSKYAGKVVLIVNTASQCGHTPQYTGMQQLHQEHKDAGLAVLAFPCNQFGAQEPGSDGDIKQFCVSKYNVGFDLFSKVDVNGKGQCELFKNLTHEGQGKGIAGPIKWNFTKFLVSRDGKVLARYEPDVDPHDPKLIGDIKKALAAK